MKIIAFILVWIIFYGISIVAGFPAAAFLACIPATIAAVTV